MSKTDVLKSIRELAGSVFENSIDYEKGKYGLDEIYNHFQKITSITGFDSRIENLAAVPTAKGKALGLNYAAQCLLDYKRTLKFIKAIVSAITEKLNENPEKEVRVFYAGCGPYATFLTLIAPLFQANQVQFSLLEINKNSVVSAKKLIDSLDLSDYLIEFHIGDAVTFKVPDSDSYDIVISETLDALLYRECYVPILVNLLPQFRNDVLLLPENVLIDLSFSSSSDSKSEVKELKMGNAFNVREAISALPISESIPAEFPEKKIDLTNVNLDTFEKLFLDTRVKIYQDIWLERNESSLTVPFESILQKPNDSNSITFTYHMEPEIELKCKFE